MIDEIIEIFKQRQNYISGKISYVFAFVVFSLTLGFSVNTLGFQSTLLSWIVIFLELLAFIYIFIRIIRIIDQKVEDNQKNLENLCFIKAKSQDHFSNGQKEQLNQILNLLHKENKSKKSSPHEKSISELIENLAREFE
jgi:biopolymer transport protein ExbB/TolQ